MRNGRLLALCALALGIALAGSASARPASEEAEAGEGALDREIAVLSLDALGMDAERVARLEALFRNELERLARSPLPTRRRIREALRGSERLLDCGGETRCLTRIGQKLGVSLVVFGSVASLGDSFILDIKAVDAEKGEELRRIKSDPLRGEPDELIEAVRVAAYRLLAPERLRGSIMVLTDIQGARVKLDGDAVGETPLSRPIDGLPLGEHRLRVESEDYSPFEEKVRVRFQKTTRVVVQLLAEPEVSQPVLETEPPPRREPERWYHNEWVWVGAGALAIALGGFVGYQLAGDSVIDCNASPEACR